MADQGPKLDPKKVKQFEKGFNGQDSGPSAWDNLKAALGFGASAPVPAAQPSVTPSPSQSPGVVVPYGPSTDPQVKRQKEQYGY